MNILNVRISTHILGMHIFTHISDVMTMHVFNAIFMPKSNVIFMHILHIIFMHIYIYIWQRLNKSVPQTVTLEQKAQTA